MGAEARLGSQGMFGWNGTSTSWKGSHARPGWARNVHINVGVR